MRKYLYIGWAISFIISDIFAIVATSVIRLWMLDGILLCNLLYSVGYLYRMYRDGY